MDIVKITSNPEVLHQIDKLKARIQQPQHAISDIVDDAGNQYVDLVMEGGGMLGIALVGYTWALEQMGIRFLGVGGTSAGSINALLLAALDEPAKPKSLKVLEELGSQNFYDFVDGGNDVRHLIELALGSDQSFKILRMAWYFVKVKTRLCSNYGLNKGDAFLEWISGLLDDAGIRTLADLDERLAMTPAGLRRSDNTPFVNNIVPKGGLVIVTADVTTETRVEFPRMASLYWRDPQTVSPSYFARASMSIPFFFEPFRVQNVPKDKNAKEDWDRHAGYDVEEDPTAIIPDTAMFVDGGIMSNFPIDAFHQTNRVPSRPTFGVKLEYDERYHGPKDLPIPAAGHLKNLLPLAKTIFNSARHTLDYEFIKKHPDYQHLVQYIPCTYKDSKTGKSCSYNWIDFNMSEEHKAGLFIQGAQKAIEFIDNFSGPVSNEGKPVDNKNPKAFESKWSYYKVLRQQLMGVSNFNMQKVTPNKKSEYDLHEQDEYQTS